MMVILIFKLLLDRTEFHEIQPCKLINTNTIFYLAQIVKLDLNIVMYY